METLRFLNKQLNQNERQNFSNWWKEQINIYGQEIVYYTNNTQLSSSNPLYGESPDAGFAPGQPLIIALALNNDSLLLSKFGLIAEGDVTAVIHPELFTSVFGVSAEPRAGDLISLTEFGSDRINFPKRGATVYELTESVDEFKQNALGGHYVWFLSAKRYMFAHEPGSPGAGVGNVALDDNVKIETVATENFDHELDNVCSNSSVYGNY